MGLTRYLMTPTSRRVALKGLIGASAMAHAVKMQFVSAQDSEAPTPATFKQPQTLIVGGLDSRQQGEPENSDVLMLARVDLAAKLVRVISIPRDLYIDIPGFGADKITRAYDFGSKSQNGKFKAGAELMKATIEQSFGMTHRWRGSDHLPRLRACRRRIRRRRRQQPVRVVADDQYPTLDYGYMSIFFPAGEQTLTGEQALQFCRTRHQDGDPGRVMRQQLVLRGLLDKAASPDYAGDALGHRQGEQEGGPDRPRPVQAACLCPGRARLHQRQCLTSRP